VANIPIVYTLTACPTCDKLRAAWHRQRIQYEERQVDQSQETLDEALNYADTVPIIVYPDGRVVIGFNGETG